MEVQKRSGTRSEKGTVLASDSDLVRAARAGDKQAFVEIVARYQATVCGIALGILADFAASEDAGQEAFLTAWRKLDDLREPERLRGWLSQIARNAALGQLRRKQPAPVSLENALAVADECPGPDETAATDEETALVRAALSQLPEQYRLILILYYREGQSVRAVAQALELSEDAVKQRLARGREILRERMSGVIERVLGRTAPGPVFTMTVAVAIGALVAPAVVAGSVFSAASSAAASTASTSILTTMSTSKVFLGAAAALALLCIPVGYHLGSPNERTSATDFRAPQAPELTSKARSKPSFENSALFVEWRELHEKHGTNGAAMPVLHKAISDMADPFRRRAFHTALVAEWVEVDPKAGLEFFLEKGRDSRQRRQFVGEWLAADPQSAVEGLLRQPGSEEMLREYLPEIARRVPERVAEIASRLPKPESFYDREVRDAFAILAGNGLAEARRLAEGVSGPSREQALSGVSLAWAKVDLDAAIAWARELPAGTDRDEIIRAALIGQASIDSKAALDRLQLVPRGGKHLHANSTTAARVLHEAAASNFDSAVLWLTEHPGQLTPEDVRGLTSAVTERLNRDAAGALTQWSNEGSLGPILPAIESALINLAVGQSGAVWDWLQKQPGTESTKRLREHVLRSAGWNDQDLAFRMVRDIPQTAEGARELQELAGALFSGGYELHRFDKALAEAPERLRPVVVEKAFGNLGSEVDDPQVWIDRLDLLPKEAQAKGIASIAGAWAMQSPEESVDWMSSLAEGPPRNLAAAAVAKKWARNDAHAAAEWVASLPLGMERDHAAESLVAEIGARYPHEAWRWSLAIQSPELQKEAITHAAREISRRDPSMGQRLLESAPLTAVAREEIRGALFATTPVQTRDGSR
jgi:RNA polymerase sigma factor (sigma-70 family)